MLPENSLLHAPPRYYIGYFMQHKTDFNGEVIVANEYYFHQLALLSVEVINSKFIEGG
jgi:hypothetical protein